jgi:phosphoglycolate phosphatase
MRGLILFDIDGTILRAGDRAHGRAFVRAFLDVFSVEATLEGVPLAGMLDAQIARIALQPYAIDDDQISALLPELMDVMGRHYRDLIASEERRSWLLPGVVRLAESLRDDGFALGVLTGNAAMVARTKLESAGVAELFPVGAYGDSARERGHLVPVALDQAKEQYAVTFSSERTMLIGDTPRDIEAARHAKAGAFGVATGRYAVSVLDQHGPDILMPDLSDSERAHRLIAEWLDGR